MGNKEGDLLGADHFEVQAGIALDDVRDPVEGFVHAELVRLTVAAEVFAADLRNTLALGSDSRTECGYADGADAEHVWVRDGGGLVVFEVSCSACGLRGRSVVTITGAAVPA